jgi:hypothetical protein
MSENEEIIKTNEEILNLLKEVGDRLDALNKEPSPKAVNICFDNDEYEELSKLKGDKSWRDFILELAKKC